MAWLGWLGGYSEKGRQRAEITCVEKTFFQPEILRRFPSKTIILRDIGTNL